jgi:hypothetical protein
MWGNVEYYEFYRRKVSYFRVKEKANQEAAGHRGKMPQTGPAVNCI